MKYIGFWILFSILLQACSSQHEEKVRRLKVDFSSGKLNSSCEFNRVEFISLETKNENIIRSISKVVALDSVYVVFSSRPDNCVAIYDYCGRYKYSYRKTGKGPGEFICAYSMHVDSCIHVYDRRKNAIQTYDLQGQYIGMSSKVGCFSKFLFKDHLLALYDYNDKSSQFKNIPLNHKLNIFNVTDDAHPKLVFTDIELHSNRQKYMKVILSNNFYLCNDDLFYWTFPADTIFRVNMESLQKESFAILDLGSKKITKDFLDKPWKSVREFALERRKRNFYSLYDYYALKKNVFCFSSKDNYIGVGHLEADSLVCYNKMQLFSNKNMPLVKFNFNTRIVGSIAHDRIIFSWEAYDFVKYCKKAKQLVSPIDWEKILSQYPGLKKTIRETTEESNPVLMIATLK